MNQGKLPSPEPGLGGGPISSSGVLPPVSTPTPSSHGGSRSTSPPEHVKVLGPSSLSQGVITHTSASTGTGTSNNENIPPPPLPARHGQGASQAHAHGNNNTHKERVLKDMNEPDIPIVFKTFTHDTAWEVGVALRTHFMQEYPNYQEMGGPGLIIQVVLMNGLIAFQSVVGEASTIGPSNMEWASAKFNTVRKYGKATLRIGHEFTQKQKDPASVGIVFPQYAAAGGGVPFFMEGCTLAPIGAIIVSGLPQKEDHQLILDTMFGPCKHLLASQ